jgi:hypothetical protein
MTRSIRKNKLKTSVDKLTQIEDLFKYHDRDVPCHISLDNDNFYNIENSEAKKYKGLDVPNLHLILTQSFYKTSNLTIENKKSCYKVDFEWNYLSLMKIVLGAYGSGKSSAGLRKIIQTSIMLPVCDDGVRKGKFIIVRNTSGELETTTMRTFKYWMYGLPTPNQRKKPVHTLIYDFYSNDKVRNIIEFIFLALDRPQDVDKLQSLEISGAFVDELQHIPSEIMNTILDRMPRYPSKIEYMQLFNDTFKDKLKMLTEKEKDVLYEEWQPFGKIFLAVTNAPKLDHYIRVKIEEIEDHPIKVYHQPPALLKDKDNKWVINPNADNLKNVGRDYYMSMISRGEEYVKVYACGQYGVALDGKFVYQNYDDDRHSVDTLPLVTSEPILIYVDYGTFPAVLICQYYKDQFRAVKEFCGASMTVKELFSVSVMPFLSKYGKGFSIAAIKGDPADTDHGSEQLRSLGFDVDSAVTNKLEPRISSVRNALNEFFNKQPKILISRQGCPKLREGFLGEYYYKRLKVIGEDRHQEVPYKSHPYSDLQDCFQYFVIDFAGNNYTFTEDERQEEYETQQAMKTREQHKSTVTGY